MSLTNSVLQLLIIVLFELIWQYGFNHCLTFLRINNIPIQDKNTPTKFPVNEIEQWQPTPHQLPIFVKSGNIWPFSEIKKKTLTYLFKVCIHLQNFMSIRPKLRKFYQLFKNQEIGPREVSKIGRALKIYINHLLTTSFYPV